MRCFILVLIGLAACGGRVQGEAPPAEETTLGDAGKWEKNGGDCPDVSAALPPKDPRCEGVADSYACAWDSPGIAVYVDTDGHSAVVTGRDGAGKTLCRSYYEKR